MTIKMKLFIVVSVLPKDRNGTKCQIVAMCGGTEPTVGHKSFSRGRYMQNIKVWPPWGHFFLGKKAILKKEEKIILKIQKEHKRPRSGQSTTTYVGGYDASD